MDPNKIKINTPLNPAGSTNPPIQNIVSIPANGEDFSDVENEMRTRFELLPEDIQQVLASSEYQTKLFEIAKARKITYEQLGALEIETTMVLLGMTKPDEYRDELMIQLKLSDEEINALVQDISAQIFQPIRQSIEKMYAAKDTAENAFKEPEVIPTTENAAFKSAGVEILDANGNTVGINANSTPASALASDGQARIASTPSTGPQVASAPSYGGPREAPTVNLSGLNRDALLQSIENPPAGNSQSLGTQSTERGAQSVDTQSAKPGTWSVANGPSQNQIPTIQKIVTPTPSPIPAPKSGIQQITRSTITQSTERGAQSIPMPNPAPAPMASIPNIKTPPPAWVPDQGGTQSAEHGAQNMGTPASAFASDGQAKITPMPSSIPPSKTDYTLKPSNTAPKTGPAGGADPYREVV